MLFCSALWSTSPQCRKPPDRNTFYNFLESGPFLQGRKTIIDFVSQPVRFCWTNKLNKSIKVKPWYIQCISTFPNVFYKWIVLNKLLRQLHNLHTKNTMSATFIATGRIFSACLSYDIALPDTQSRHQKPRRKLKKTLEITVSSDKRLSAITQRWVTYITVIKCSASSNAS